MKILFPASEAAPIYKVGGLGDVAGSLPKALYQAGHDVRIILPRHPQIELDPSQWTESARFQVVYDRLPRTISVWHGYLPGSGVKVYLFAEPSMISQPSDASDKEVDKFALFSLAVAYWLHHQVGSWRPDIIHLNDWHVSLVPLLLKYKFDDFGYKTLLTIHNLRYQGITPSNILQKLDIKPDASQILAWDQADGDVDILMEGILHADYINTVSPTYAKEILTPEYGSGLEQVLYARSARLSGILNGIDTDKWNPETDSVLVQNYSTANAMAGKKANKQYLQKKLGLESDSDSRLIAFIGRIDAGQKGIDLIIQAITQHQMLQPNRQMVFLGTGDPYLEDQLRQLDQEYQSVRSIIKFDGELARQIYAGADLMLVPSRYEPCGLVQMIAMRYGTVPVVRKTGGLADTVEEQHTGFLFTPYSPAALKQAVDRADDFMQNETNRQQIVKSCMQQDFSWPHQAAKYIKLYQQMLSD